MAYEMKDLQGSLFVNDKQGNDRRPDMKGKILINGQTYWLSAWKQQSQQGQTYLSLKAELSQGATAAPAAPKPQDDGFPFDL